MTRPAPPRRRPASPVLGAAMSAIGEASAALVPRDSRFRHSFEAPLERIRPDPAQPRRHFDPEALAALAATMAAQGQLQPVLLRRDPERPGGWVLVAGERRWRAARQNGWSSLLAIEHEGDAELAALLENLQRADLAPVEAARGVQRLLAREGMSQAEAARLLGQSPAEISATLRLLTLPEAFLARMARLPRNVLVELARLEEGPVRQRLMQLAERGELTVRAIRQAARGGPDAPRPEAAGAPRTLLPAAAVERLAARLAARRQSGRPLSPPERDGLEALRREIAALLEA